MSHGEQLNLFDGLLADRFMDGAAGDPAPAILAGDDRVGRVGRRMLEGGSVSRLTCEEMGIPANSSIHTFVAPIRNQALIPVAKTTVNKVAFYSITETERAAFKDARAEQMERQRYEVFNRRYTRAARRFVKALATADEYPNLAENDELLIPLLESALTQARRHLDNIKKKAGVSSAGHKE